MLPAFLIRDIQNDGLVIWENKLPPSLQVGGKIQREAHDKDSKLWWESPLLLSHGTIQGTTSSAQAGNLSQHPTGPNRTEKICSNQIETPKSPVKNDKKMEGIGSLKLGNLWQVQSFSKLPSVLKPEIIN